MLRQLNRMGRRPNAAARSPFAAVVLVPVLGAAPLAAQQVIEDADITRAVEADARNATGVWRVRNHIKVRPLTVVRRLYGPYPTYDVPLPPPFGS